MRTIMIASAFLLAACATAPDCATLGSGWEKTGSEPYEKAPNCAVQSYANSACPKTVATAMICQPME